MQTDSSSCKMIRAQVSIFKFHPELMFNSKEEQEGELQQKGKKYEEEDHFDSASTSTKPTDLMASSHPL